MTSRRSFLKNTVYLNIHIKSQIYWVTKCCWKSKFDSEDCKNILLALQNEANYDTKCKIAKKVAKLCISDPLFFKAVQWECIFSLLSSDYTYILLSCLIALSRHNIEEFSDAIYQFNEYKCYDIINERIDEGDVTENASLLLNELYEIFNSMKH